MGTATRPVPLPRAPPLTRPCARSSLSLSASASVSPAVRRRSAGRRNRPSPRRRLGRGRAGGVGALARQGFGCRGARGLRGGAPSRFGPARGAGRGGGLGDRGGWSHWCQGGWPLRCGGPRGRVRASLHAPSRTRPLANPDLRRRIGMDRAARRAGQRSKRLSPALVKRPCTARSSR